MTDEHLTEQQSEQIAEYAAAGRPIWELPDDLYEIEAAEAEHYAEMLANYYPQLSDEQVDGMVWVDCNDGCGAQLVAGRYAREHSDWHDANDEVAGR